MSKLQLVTFAAVAKFRQPLKVGDFEKGSAELVTVPGQGTDLKSLVERFLRTGDLGPDDVVKQESYSENTEDFDGLDEEKLMQMDIAERKQVLDDYILRLQERRLALEDDGQQTGAKEPRPEASGQKAEGQPPEDDKDKLTSAPVEGLKQ